MIIALVASLESSYWESFRISWVYVSHASGQLLHIEIQLRSVSAIASLVQPNSCSLAVLLYQDVVNPNTQSYCQMSVEIENDKVSAEKEFR